VQKRTKTDIPLPRLDPSVFHTHTKLKSVKHALKDPMWLEAMKEEYSALDKNKTWTLVPLPPKRTTIRCK